MPEQLLARVEQCYQQAEAFFQRPFPRPSVTFALRGQKAGVAHLQDNHLRFNQHLYQENHHNFLQQTVAHEVAHLVAYRVFGSGIKPHGREWQRVMQDVFSLPAKRCHQYVLKLRQTLRYIYHCACPKQDFTFTAQRHARVLKGQRYRCKVCGQLLSYSGQQRIE